MKKILFILILMFLFLIVSVQATSLPSITTLPGNISLECGNNYNEVFQLDGTKNNTITNVIQGTGSSYFMTLNDVGINSLRVSIFYVGISCSTGISTFSFKLDGVPYEIKLQVVEDLYQLYDKKPYPLAEGQKFSIGNTIHFNLLDVGSNFVDYSLEGCGDSEEERLYMGGVLEKICGTERLGVEIFEILGIDSSTFNISFSTQSLTLSKSYSDSSDTNPSGCKLGFSTLGNVERERLITIKVVDEHKNNLYTPGAIVTITDLSGGMSVKRGTTDTTGIYTTLIGSDAQGPLLIQLEKEGCEAYSDQIQFEKSYQTYKLEKEEEEGTYQLVLNMSGRFEMKAISGTIKNALNEVIEGVEVKITNPDNSIITVQSNVNGLFTWTPIIVGTYKIQGGKDDYQSTDLISIEIYQNKMYSIIIKVDGKRESGYKLNDRISFELRDENNTLLPISIDTATFAGINLRFISGISDTITFKDTATLSIPSIEGYASQSLTLTAKETNLAKWFYWAGYIIGGIILLVLIVAVVRKVKGGGGKSPQEMEFQLGGGG